MVENGPIITVDSPASDLFELMRKYGSEADKPLKRIFQLVIAQGCKSILVEQGYKDENWASEHKVFYGKLYKQYSSDATRLHFFTSNLTMADIGNLAKFDYIGFCVLRPSNLPKVSLAIIKPIEDCNYPKRSFIVCQEDFPVVINSFSKIPQMLTVRQGFPFIQQDGQAGCCAHAALMMAGRFLVQKRNKGKTEKEKEPYPLLENIVESISLVPGEGRKTPTPGLLPVEISQAVAGMDCAPLVYEFRKASTMPVPSDRIIYHYLESGIPVQLIIPTEEGRHALTVIGHTFNPDVWWALAQEYYSRRPSGGNYHSSTTWIENFIVHDDNFGPYLTVPKDFILAAENLYGVVIVVPLPMDVNMNGERAEMLANMFLVTEVDPQKLEQAKMQSRITAKTWDWFELFWRHYLRNDVVLRTWLLSSEDFKNNYVPSHLKSHYANMQLPAKVWLSELSIPELFCHARFRLGEIIFDSTAAPSPRQRPFLAIHVPGLLISRDVNTENLRYINIRDDFPYQHVMR
jgi:hypothetical protein